MAAIHGRVDRDNSEAHAPVEKRLKGAGPGIGARDPQFLAELVPEPAATDRSGMPAEIRQGRARDPVGTAMPPEP